MADPENSSEPETILLGPGPRPALLAPLLRALTTPDETRVRQLADLSELLGELPPDAGLGGYLLLDADETPLEDFGLVRRFLESRPERRWLLLVTGDDPAAPVARRLLARASAATWLPWPVDVEELQALARGAAADARTRATPPPPVAARGAEPGPAASPEISPVEVRDDLERRLGRELRAIEAILREEEGLLPEGDGSRADGSRVRRARAAAEPGAEALAGLELSREEIEAFLGPLEAPLPSAAEAPPERSAGLQAEESSAAESLAAEEPCDAEQRRLATATEPSAESPPSEQPASTNDDDAPPAWYRAQVADLADLAQGLGLSLHAVREANEEEGADAVELRDEALERLAGDVFRLIQFTRTLGYLAAPPGPGDQRHALATLVEEQLGGLAGAGPDSPRYLFRSDDDVAVRCDKALVVQALDALLHVADACADATDVVRVGVHDGERLARVRIDFPAGPAAGVAPARALQPYGLRRALPTIGPNALAAASRLFAGQGGRLSLGRGGPGRLVFEAELPKA